MREIDKIYIERGTHDSDPAEEVFGSIKLLIAIVAAVGLIGVLIAAWWGK